MADIVPFANKPWSYVPKDHPVSGLQTECPSVLCNALL